MLDIHNKAWSILYTLRLDNVGTYTLLSERVYVVLDDDLAVLFGRNLKAARIKRDIKQEQLCEMANLDRSYLSQIENGNYKLTLDKVYALASALQCPLIEILPEVRGVKIV